MPLRARIWMCVLLAIAGCGGTEDLGAPDADLADASTEADAPWCCPISAGPRCTYKVGGSPDEAGTCNASVVSDPPLDGWQRKIDAHGCPYWVVPTSGKVMCGADAGSDGGVICKDVHVGGASAYQKGKRLDYGEHSSILISALDLGSEIRQGRYTIYAPPNETDPPYIHTVELRDELGTVVATHDYHWGEIITYDTGVHISFRFVREHRVHVPGRLLRIVVGHSRDLRRQARARHRLRRRVHPQHVRSPLCQLRNRRRRLRWSRPVRRVSRLQHVRRCRGPASMWAVLVRPAIVPRRKERLRPHRGRLRCFSRLRLVSRGPGLCRARMCP